MAKSMIDRGRFFTTIILCSIILIACSGCSMSNYGKLESNREITQAFESYQILPNHRYYYWGTHSRPVAIAGIKEEYELISNLWVKIDPESNDFRNLIEKISIQGSGSTINPWGFIILGPSGKNLGVWYSAIRAAAVEINANSQIVNLSPIATVAIGNQRQ